MVRCPSEQNSIKPFRPCLNTTNCSENPNSWSRTRKRPSSCDFKEIHVVSDGAVVQGKSFEQCGNVLVTKHLRRKGKEIGTVSFEPPMKGIFILRYDGPGHFQTGHNHSHGGQCGHRGSG